ncbi:MAG: DHH family phosphoesterase [Nanoarchaeota archaeon]
MEFLAGDEKRFFEFMGNLNEKDKIAVISHIDLDGITSAVLATKIIGNVDYLRFIDYRPGVLKETILELKKNKINKIFILDLAVDSKEDISEMEKFAEIAIIDHHPFENDFNSEKTIFIKAESAYPAASMCYYLFSKMQKIPGWIAALGIIADKPHVYDEENNTGVFDDFNLGKDKVNLWNYVLNLNLIIIYFKGSEKKVYDLIMESKELGDLSKFDKYSKIVEKELDLWREKFEREKETFGSLVVFQIEPKYLVKSLLINEISVQDTSKTFVFISAKKGDEFLSISARNQMGNVNVSLLLRNSIMGIENSTAGGHVKAAAARVPVKFLGKFKENLIREYQKLSEKLK